MRILTKDDTEYDVEYVTRSDAEREIEGWKDQADQLRSLTLPFVNVSKAIPDNWPGECILRFSQRNDGSIYLDYYGVTDDSNGIKIDQWRSLIGINTENQ